tara:strand:+ start:32271 stop:33899 length:1629 start_codon:yes stop_codon:yes gene_type:complete
MRSATLLLIGIGVASVLILSVLLLILLGRKRRVLVAKFRHPELLINNGPNPKPNEKVVTMRLQYSYPKSYGPWTETIKLDRRSGATFNVFDPKKDVDADSVPNSLKARVLYSFIETHPAINNNRFKGDDGGHIPPVIVAGPFDPNAVYVNVNYTDTRDFVDSFFYFRVDHDLSYFSIQTQNAGPVGSPLNRSYPCVNYAGDEYFDFMLVDERDFNRGVFTSVDVIKNPFRKGNLNVLSYYPQLKLRAGDTFRSIKEQVAKNLEAVSEISPTFDSAELPVYKVDEQLSRVLAADGAQADECTNGYLATDFVHIWTKDADGRICSNSLPPPYGINYDGKPFPNPINAITGVLDVSLGPTQVYEEFIAGIVPEDLDIYYASITENSSLKNPTLGETSFVYGVSLLYLVILGRLTGSETTGTSSVFFTTDLNLYKQAGGTADMMNMYNVPPVVKFEDKIGFLLFNEAPLFSTFMRLRNPQPKFLETLRVRVAGQDTTLGNYCATNPNENKPLTFTGNFGITGKIQTGNPVVRSTLTPQSFLDINLN